MLVIDIILALLYVDIAKDKNYNVLIKLTILIN